MPQRIFQYTAIALTLTFIADGCQELPSVPFAAPEEPNLRPPFVDGVGVRYKCNEGFKEDGGSATAVCLKTYWQPPSLICVPVGCSSLPNLDKIKPVDLDKMVPFGSDNQGNPLYRVGTHVTFECEEGFVKQHGTNVAVCSLQNGHSVWDYPSLSCIGVSCGDPGNPANSLRNGTLFHYPNSVTYSCLKGYEMLPKSTVKRYCLPNSQWSDSEPHCKAIQCPPLAKLDNGVIKVPEDLSYLSIAEYNCKEGYVLMDGDNERHCLANRSWSGKAPSCKEITCPPHSSLPGGRIILGANKTKSGSLVIFHCGPPRSTRITLKCMEDGHWSELPPICLESTTQVFPTQPSQPENGRPSTLYTKCDNPGLVRDGFLTTPTVSFPTNQSITFKCKEGFKLKGTATLDCDLTSGQWMPDQLPKCDKPKTAEIIVGVTVAATLALILVVVAGFFYLKRRRKNTGTARNPIPRGNKSKAQAMDARNYEEIRFLERDRKLIPVTSL